MGLSETSSFDVLGELPEDWNTCALSEHLDTIRNGLTRKQNKHGKGLPITRIETITEDRINFNKVGFVEDVTQEEIERYSLIPGDILSGLRQFIDGRIPRRRSNKGHFGVRRNRSCN